MPAWTSGFAYRMLYVDPAAVSTALDGAKPPFVPEAVADDPALAGLLGEAFADFPQALGTAGRRCRRCPTGRPAGRPRRCRLQARRTAPIAHRAARRARDFLVAEAPRTVASEELESVSGLDRFALARHFRAAFGTSPHRFQVGRRLARARAMIAERHAAVGDGGGDGLRRPEPSHAAFLRALRPDARPLGGAVTRRLGVERVAALGVERAVDSQPRRMPASATPTGTSRRTPAADRRTTSSRSSTSTARSGSRTSSSASPPARSTSCATRWPASETMSARTSPAEPPVRKRKAALHAAARHAPRLPGPRLRPGVRQ